MRHLARVIVIAVLAWSIVFGAASECATISRDHYGVPHIVAQTEAAAAFAHGYAAAEDHAAEMAELFLRARGERARYLGPKYVDDDIRVHLLRIPEIARERFSSLAPLAQAILTNYGNGYNAFVAKHPSTVPGWARPVTGADVLAHCRAVLLLDFAFNQRKLDMRAPQPAGSNMWAIGGTRSASRRGLLLANPHLRWSGSHVFHEVHIKTPGAINVSGGALIGFPVVAIGFNESLGWSMTVNQTDSDDLYELSLDVDKPDHYRYDGMTLPFVTKVITIDVNTDAGVERREVPLVYSHFGPVVRTSKDKAYAFKSANADIVDFITQWNLMAKARNVKEFRSALDLQAIPMFNIGYADNKGNVLYFYNARLPKRRADGHMAAVQRGETSESEWYNIYPTAELPQLLNPPDGYIQNCNDSPWYVTRRRNIEPSRYSNYIRGDAIGLRGQRSLQMLESKKRFSLEDLLAAIVDDRMLLADRVKPMLVQLARRNADTQPLFDAAARALEKWDGKASPGSKGGALFMRWWEAYLPKASPVYARSWTAAAPFESPRGIGDDKRAIEALTSAAAELKEQYGSVDVDWGEVYRLRRGSLDLPASGSPGLGGSIRTLYYSPADDGRFVAVAGDSYMLVVEFGDTPVAYSLVSYSQSADSTSKHYTDQTVLYQRKQLKRAWFSSSDIEANLESKYSVE